MIVEVVNVLSCLEEHPEATFLDLVPFNGKFFGTVAITGRNPGWEMHPDTDEFFYIVEGEAEITLLDEGEPHHHVAPAGSSFVIPKGIWHKPEAPKGTKLIYFTPGESLQSDAEDPRSE